jgi:hypothetical protein
VAVAKFLTLSGGVVDSGIRLSLRPASLCSLADRYDNPMPESTISPSQGLRNWPEEGEPSLLRRYSVVGGGEGGGGSVFYVRNLFHSSNVTVLFGGSPDPSHISVRRPRHPLFILERKKKQVERTNDLIFT